MVRKMFTECSGDFTAPDRVYIYPDFTKHLDVVQQRGCKLTVGATVQPPLISPCLVPETWIGLPDRTVKREKEQPSVSLWSENPLADGGLVASTWAQDGV